MAFSTTTLQPVPPPVESTAVDHSLQADALSLGMMAAFAGAAVSRKATRKAIRKLSWQMMKAKLAALFSKGEIAGMPDWAFILLVIALAALGIYLFGLLGLLIILGLGAIIYLLLQNK